MAIDAARLASATAALHARDRRLVGWGSGSVFEYFHGLCPVGLDYLVDNDPSQWGQTRHGISIEPPERLVRETESTFVIIYSSAWPEIARQIAAIGRFEVMAASAAFADTGARARLAWCEQLVARPVRRRPRPERAIVLQGPLLDDTAVRVLSATAALHPSDSIVLSTWADTPSSLLAQCAPFVDDVVLSDKPAQSGIQNRNAQIVSTRAGIDRAVARGAKTILKTRSDLAILARSIFEQAAWLDAHTGCAAARQAGLRGRLIVPASYTRKFLLYHPSDLAMLGHAEDMVRFWAAPLDTRSGDLLSADWIDRPLAAVNLEGNPAESYLGTAFCRALNRTCRGTIADSWAFYRDLFVVVDNDWFDLLWFKNLTIPDAAVRHGVRQTVSHAFWQRLQSAHGSVDEEAREVDVDALTLRAFARGLAA